jgi:hypothetical protein
MKKVVLSACICLLGLSLQASQDWRTEQDYELSIKYARVYFQRAKEHITREDIRDAMQRFPNFLRWTYPEMSNCLITHIIGRYGEDANVLYYLLGFSPPTNFVDGNGLSPVSGCHNLELQEIFTNYKVNPWRHPVTVFDLPVDHMEYLYDGKPFGQNDELIEDNNHSHETSFFSTVGEKKLLGLGVVVILGILYRYKSGKDEEVPVVA